MKVQRRATKFILNDYSSNYKSRLTALRLLLMMVYELHDTSFFIKCLKHPTASFNIMNYIKFSAGSTRSSSFHKLVHPSQSKSKHFYFNRLPRLWNSLPPIDLNQSHDTIMNSIKTLLGLPSWTILMTISHAHSISAAYATHVAVPPE